MERSEEFCIKLERIRGYLAEKSLKGAVLSRSDNFAWVGCGANSVVDSSSEMGAGTLVVSGDWVALIANNIETERLLTEELNGLDLSDVRTFPWHQPEKKEQIVAELAGEGNFAADDAATGLPMLPADFVSLRYELTEAEIERYRKLGLDSQTAVETAARSVEKGMTEADVAALLASECRKRGITPVVALVAADERIRRWRHPVVKNTPVRQYVMLVACGRRAGLVAAISRLVHFGPLSEDLHGRHRAVCEVDATLILNTAVGRTAGEALEAGLKAYARAGWPDEWQNHHQGGAIGYRPREYIANQQCAEVVRSRQAFAWNPSICGTKSEDTILVSEAGVELLTAPSEDWPAITVEMDGKSIRRADILTK